MSDFIIKLTTNDFSYNLSIMSQEQVVVEKQEALLVLRLCKIDAIKR